MLADSGYFSAANVDACANAGIEPLIAIGRQTHYPPLGERLATAAGKSDARRGHGPPPEDTRRQKAQRPAQADTEPVFGIIKAVLGFRQFSMRGYQKVCGEWNLVTMAGNIKRTFALIPASWDFSSRRRGNAWLQTPEMTFREPTPGPNTSSGRPTAFYLRPRTSVRQPALHRVLR
jgi:hypothetical protein